MYKLIILFICAPLGAFSQNKEPWIDMPREKWPQIALVNDVLYKNGDTHQDTTVTYAGTAFLLDTGKDTLAVTVKHVLWAARNRYSDRVSVNRHLKTWKMYPKNDPDAPVIIDSLINEDESEKLWDEDRGVLQRDWIVFTAKYIPPGIQPLTVSNDPVRVGDDIHLIANPYSFEQTLMVSGKIVKREGSLFLARFQEVDTVALGGASGSPVINRKGHLVGIFSNSLMNATSGKWTAVINSTDYLEKVLSRAKPLNKNRQHISVYLDSLIRTQDTEKALKLFDTFLKTETVYYDYEVTYINYGGNILEIGENLLALKRIDDAILYFNFFHRKYPDNTGYLFALAKSYLQRNKRQKAIDILKAAREKAIVAGTKDEIAKFLQKI